MADEDPAKNKEEPAKPAPNERAAAGDAPRAPQRPPIGRRTPTTRRELEEFRARLQSKFR